MRHFYIDTNVIIDFISLRKPFGDAALALFGLSDKGKIKLYTSSHGIPTAHYILRKIYSEEQVRKALNSVLDYLEVISVTEGILRKALRSAHKDYEDAIHILCAHAVKNISGIVTRDLKDFATSEIPVYSPDEILQLVKKK